jgi:hypothetical protein
LLDETNRALLERENVYLIYDPDSRITFDTFGTARLPETIIAGPDQNMRHKLVGADWTVDDVKPFIRTGNTQ